MPSACTSDAVTEVVFVNAVELLPSASVPTSVIDVSVGGTVSTSMLSPSSLDTLPTSSLKSTRIVLVPLPAENGKVLVVGEEAELTVSALDVGTLIVRGGTIRGDITARVTVEVYAPSTVLGNISSPEVFIDKGVRFEGGVKMPTPDH